MQLEPDLQKISTHMISLGLGALAHANYHAHLYSNENEMWSELSVLQAGHAAEILIKARIAQEHPLLIFEQLPRSTQIDADYVELRHLVEKAKTIQYFDLPERLWISTGIKIDDLDIFSSFGKLRNSIQHFLPPSDVDFTKKTLEFIYSIIDPFIYKCWGLYAIDYNEDYEPYQYLVDVLIRYGIKFLISPNSVKDIEISSFKWTENDDEYRTEMINRINHAQSMKTIQ
jgi:hypothetical protein